MKDASDDTGMFGEVTRGSLADTLARRIRAMIQSGEYTEGDRLPAILEMARRFGVGPPTMREALKKLETLGVVDVRHGSGVYVASRRELLVLARPQLGGAVDYALLSDLVDARVPLEVAATRAAAERASGEEIAAMRHLLASVVGSVDEHRLVAADAAFHRQLAAASGNTIVAQMLDALRDLFTGEERMVWWEPLLRDADSGAHSRILDAVEQRDADTAGELMRAHLVTVRDAVTAARGAQRTA
jgi:GntR family transcriptional regulator, transcriptional repressor for pyruvate dehydrogenase complex